MTPLRKGRFIFTSIKTPAVIATVFILSLLLGLREGSARTTHYPDSYYEDIRQRVESLVEKNNKRKTDFLMARYLGVASVDPGTQKNPKDLELLIKKRLLTPSSFLSDEYDPEFIDWFVKSSYVNWGVEESHVREKSGAYEIRAVNYKDYFLTIAATPELQSWFISGTSEAPLILAAGSFSAKPIVYSGKLVNNDPTLYFPIVGLDVGKHSLLYVWPPEFYDLEGDGIPEVWIRYNVTALNGFSQVLAIYKIENDSQLVLFRKFKGDAEGISRRLEGNKIQVGHGIGSKLNIPHMSYDLYRLETWEFADGEFKKVSEEKIPHILKNKEWKKYCLDDHEPWMDKYKLSA